MSPVLRMERELGHGPYLSPTHGDSRLGVSNDGPRETTTHSAVVLPGWNVDEWIWRRAWGGRTVSSHPYPPLGGNRVSRLLGTERVLGHGISLSPPQEDSRVANNGKGGITLPRAIAVTDGMYTGACGAMHAERNPLVGIHIPC